jgi:hypothetical protein
MNINKEVEDIIEEITNKLKTQCCLTNKYGIILASTINEFPKNKIIPPKLFKLISNRRGYAEALKIDKIESFIIETKEFYYLFSFNEELLLISKLKLDIDLTKFTKNISIFLESLIKKIHQLEEPAVSRFDFSEEINQMENSLNKANKNEEKYSIIKELVRFIAKKE